MTIERVRRAIVRQSKPYGTIEKWCRAHGLPKSRVSEAMNGKRLPSDAILHALGFEWRIVRVKRVSEPVVPAPAPHPTADERQGDD